MKKIRMAAILMALVLGGLTSCTKDNSGTAATNTSSLIANGNVKGDPGTIATTLQQGSWVASYSDNSETPANLTGYAFNFGASNYLNAIYNGGVVYNGTWSADESAHNITIDFGMAAFPLSVTNGNWHVVDISQSMARLQRSDGSATLTFQKTVSGS